ncbi:hypothetical protein Lser_V15G04227 [Lactuca serriola]
MMMGKLLQFGRRQIHTIISRETIKPSSPTPSHLQRYNLSSLDQLFQHTYTPLILFYPNNGNYTLSAEDKAHVMKKSLSKSLSQYYPFAGRLPTPTTPYVDCNDEGVVFVEARNDCHLKMFEHISETDETLEHLFPDDMVCYKSPSNTSLVGVQLNHFSCGGVGVAVSMSHVIGDGRTLGAFFSHWASVTRYGSTDHQEVLPLNPYFIHSPSTGSLMPKAQVINQGHTNHVARKFVFPNTKLIDLKNKVIAMAAAGSTPPTRVDVLTSLLYKTAITATTTKSGFFKPSCLMIPMDIRKKFVQKLPQTTVGNFLLGMIVQTRHTSETSLSVIVEEIRKEKSQLQGIQSVQHAAENITSLMSKLRNGDSEDATNTIYVCSSFCGFSYNQADFRWGKPMGATLALKSLDNIGFVLKDTPNGDGVEALVILEEEVMEIFQNDKEMLSFCHSNHN